MRKLTLRHFPFSPRVKTRMAYRYKLLKTHWGLISMLSGRLKDT